MAQISAFASFFLFGRAGAAAENHIPFAHVVQCRRAVGLSVPMILA